MEERQRILVIDDDRALQQSCRMVLASQGYDLDAAFDGISGLEKFERSTPDVVLVDLRMPGLGGLEVLPRLKAIDPDCVAIVITGYATIESAVEAMKRGAYDFLPKPFTPDQLRLIVTRGLERRMFVRETARLRHEKEMMRDNFISMVSHELRSPLNAVQQNLMVITAGLGGQVSEKARDTLVAMQARIRSLISLVNDWLDLARIESGEMVSGRGPVDLKAVVSDALETLRPLAEEAGVSLSLRAPRDLPRVTGSAQALGMLFMNLVHNGIKFNRQGGTVAVDLRTDGPDLIAEVSDTGVGIAADKIPLIFEQFYRIIEEGRVEGSGLGLSIAQKVVVAHGGTIDVASDVGKGTSFTIRLPRGGGEQNTAGKGKQV
jgi:two-component system sensor histidine kinase/response regulator